MKMEQTECSEMLAFKLQMLGNHPEESIRHNKSSLQEPATGPCSLLNRSSQMPLPCLFTHPF
jgi:hypothetical protein